MREIDELVVAIQRGIDNPATVGIMVLQEDAEKILEALKKQKAIEPDADSEGTCTCGNCGETVGYCSLGCNKPVKLCKFCPKCGQAVKWE